MAGKGSKRRQEDPKKIRANWDEIPWSKKFTGFLDSKGNKIHLGDTFQAFDECGAELIGKIIFDVGEYKIEQPAERHGVKLTHADLKHWWKAGEVIK